MTPVPFADSTLETPTEASAAISRALCYLETEAEKIGFHRLAALIHLAAVEAREYAP